MKKITIILSALLALGACQKHYEFNTDFTLPTTLDNPSAVTLDVTSSQTVVLSWEGGKAADGGLVLYEVLFDKEGGDFSSPVDVRKSDQGALSQLTLSHAEVNAIARKAGIKPNESGTSHLDGESLQRRRVQDPGRLWNHFHYPRRRH